MERLKNGPLLIAVVLAIAAGLVYFGARSNRLAREAQNAQPASVSAPATPTSGEAQPQQAPAPTKEEKKAKRDEVIIG